MTARAPAHDASPAVEVIVESGLWTARPDAEATVRRAIDEAAAQASPQRGRREVSHGTLSTATRSAARSGH